MNDEQRDALYMEGWLSGNRKGRESGRRNERKRLGDLIEAEIIDLKKAPVMVDREFIDGLERALELIEGASA
jgi:hypothetical protein